MDSPFSWIRRRRFLYAVNLFCALSIGWILWHDMSSAVAEAAITMAFITIMTSVGSYVFGATWDDKNRATLSNFQTAQHQKPTVENQNARNTVSV